MNNNQLDKEYYNFLVSKYRLNDPAFDKEYFNFLINNYNYKDIVHEKFKNVVAPKFKKRGYKKKGGTFYLERDGLIEICNVQFSRYNDRTFASFTYNIQIAIPSLYDLLQLHYTDKLQTTIWGERFGDIILWANGISSAYDYWYRLEAYSQNTLSGDNTEYTDELEKIHSIFYKLEKRYNRQTGEGFNEVINDDTDNIITKFFNSMPNADLLLKHINEDEPNGYIDESMMLGVAELYYFNGEYEKGRRIFNKLRHGQYQEIINRYTEEGDIVL